MITEFENDLISNLWSKIKRVYKKYIYISFEVF